METIAQDLRDGSRMMRRSPAVAVVAILSLGLGIGGAAAVFGLTDGGSRGRGVAAGGS